MAARDPRGSEDMQLPVIRGSVESFLENLRLVVDGIASIFGANCEVVLHDLRHPEASIVAIANGHVTGRKVGYPVIGGPLDDEGLKVLVQQADQHGIVSGYVTHTRDGRMLKSTSMTFKNSRGIPVAALCINLDLTEFKRAQKLLDDICTTNGKSRRVKTRAEEHGGPPGDVTAIIKSIVDEAIAGLQAPVALADKDDKLNAIRTMHERGLFLVKGGVDYAARALGVSRFTIYNYLKELQFRDEGSGLEVQEWQRPAQLE